MVSLSFSGEAEVRAVFVGVLIEVDIMQMLMPTSEGSVLVKAGIEMRSERGMRKDFKDAMREPARLV